MKLLKLVIIFAFVGCKSVTISEANKALVKKGNKLGKDFIEYKVLLKSNTDFKIKNISLDKDFSRLNFFYKDLKTGLSSYKMLDPFPKGDYSFNFKIKDITRFNNKEFLKIDYMVGGESYSKKIKIEQKTSITKRR